MHHFVVSDGRGPIWDNAEDKSFVEMPVDQRLDTHGALEVVEVFEPSQYEALSGQFSVTGTLGIAKILDATGKPLEVTEQELALSVDFLIGERYEAVEIFSDAPPSLDGEEDWRYECGKAFVDARHTLGTYIEFNTLADGFQGTVELNQMQENAFDEISGYVFLKLLDFAPNSVLDALIESAYIEIDYDVTKLNALNIPEKALALFYWNRLTTPAQWEEAEAVVDTAQNLVRSNTPPLAPVGIFAKKSMMSAVEDREDANSPGRFSLAQNFPNPFNPSTTIRFALSASIHGTVRCELSVYNTNGQKVRTLLHRGFKAGLHEILWDGRDDHGQRVSSGVYFYRLSAGSFTEIRKMVVTK